jgi:hypothetical protein
MKENIYTSFFENIYNQKYERISKRELCKYQYKVYFEVNITRINLSNYIYAPRKLTIIYYMYCHQLIDFYVEQPHRRDTLASV